MPEAARLVQTTTTRVRRWLLGYRFPLRTGATAQSAPIFKPQLPQTEGHWAIGFLDLVELLFIKGFRDMRIALPYIRLAARRAAKRWKTDHPFCLKRFSTDGYEIFETLVDEVGEEELREVTKGQYHFYSVLGPYLRQLDYSDAGDVLRWWPLGKKRDIVVDPAVAFGRPVVVGSSVPTEAIFAAVGANESERQVATWYDLPISSVRAAVEFEESRAA